LEDEEDRTCSIQGNDKKCMQVLVIKPEGNRPLKRSRHRMEGIKLEDNERAEGKE
jgi:hypothetical protein